MANDEQFREWAIVELMGHRRLAGMVSEQTIAGQAFLRIDVPGEGDAIEATQFYGANSVYCLTPTTEEVARAAARRNNVAPVSRWELAAPRPDLVGEDAHDGDQF